MQNVLNQTVQLQSTVQTKPYNFCHTFFQKRKKGSKTLRIHCMKKLLLVRFEYQLPIYRTAESHF